MALFEDLAQIDIVTPVMDLLSNGTIIYGLDGKFRLGGERGLKVQSPWIDTAIAEDRICGLWHGIYFKQYEIISRNCFNCWKIVVRPKTLKDLFKLYELQQKMGLPAKCGAERRGYATHKGWYAGFWYCPMEGGLEGAREFYKKISLRVKDSLGIQTPVILKRACTEYEDKYGPSNLWEYPEGWKMLEDLLDATWEFDMTKGDPMPTPLKVAITRVWIEWARRHGDPTADEFCEGSDTFGVTDTITYHSNKIEPVDNPPITYRPWEEEEGGEDDSSAKIQRLPSD